MKPEEPTDERGERHREPADNVVQLFPRDWLGPHDQLVPFGGVAGEHDSSPRARRPDRRTPPRRISGPVEGSHGDRSDAGEHAHGPEPATPATTPRHLVSIRPGQHGRNDRSDPEAPLGAQADPEARLGAQADPEARLGAHSGPQAPLSAQADPEVPLGAQSGPRAPLSAQAFWSDAAPLLHDPIESASPSEQKPADLPPSAGARSAQGSFHSISLPRALSGIAVLAFLAMSLVGVLGSGAGPRPRPPALAAGASARSFEHRASSLPAQGGVSGAVVHSSSPRRQRRTAESDRHTLVHARRRASAVSTVAPAQGSAAPESAGTSSVNSSYAPASGGYQDSTPPSSAAGGTVTSGPAPTSEPSTTSAATESASSRSAGASTTSGPQGPGAPFGPGQVN